MQYTLTAASKVWILQTRHVNVHQMTYDICLEEDDIHEYEHKMDW